MDHQVPYGKIMIRDHGSQGVLMDTIMVVYHILSLTPTKRPPRPLALLSTQRSRMPGFYHSQVTFFTFIHKMSSCNQLSAQHQNCLVGQWVFWPTLVSSIYTENLLDVILLKEKRRKLQQIKHFDWIKLNS